jgi:hypothetical protein
MSHSTFGLNGTGSTIVLHSAPGGVFYSSSPPRAQSKNIFRVYIGWDRCMAGDDEG